MFDTLFTGKNFIELAETDSTNTYACKLLTELPPEGTVVLSHSQSRGRGQTGNHWESETGKNFTASVIYYPTFLKSHELFYLSKMVSVALQEYLDTLISQEPVSIKWPNDILVGNQKIAGILIENQLEGSHVRSTVIGIGLNVNQRDFSPMISAKTCSIRHFRDENLEILQVANDLFQILESQYIRLRQGQQTLLDRIYLRHLYGYQEEITVRVGDAISQGYIIGINKDGKLALQTEGIVRYFDIKEISFVL